jgi:type VI secretion system secreted protein VgrG
VVTFQEGDPDRPLITGCVPNKVNSVPCSLPTNKTRTVLRSQSSPRNGGYNELSIEDRAGQEKIYLRAQRDLEQLILNDSHSLIGHDRIQQVDHNSTSLIKGDELHTTHGARTTVVGGDELISISGSSTSVGGTFVIQAGQQVHLCSADVVISAEQSLTLSAGGQHIVINAGGIFSSVAIVEGGNALAGLPGQVALAVGPEAIAIEALPIEALLKQDIAFREADSALCPLCDAATGRSGAEGTQA